MESYFLTKASFRVVETNFLASGNDFLYIFFRDSCQKKLFSPSSGNIFLNESFIPAIGEGFPFSWRPSTLIESFFLLADTVTYMNENQFLKKKIIPVGGN